MNPRRWLARRTLRGRLIAGLLALLAVACAAVGVTSYVALEGFLTRQVDGQLMASSQRYEQCEREAHPDRDPAADGPVAGGPPGCQPGSIPGLSPLTFTATVSHGMLVESGLTLGTCHLSPGDRAMLTALPPDSLPSTHTLSGLGPYRLTAVPSGGDTHVITGVPLASFDRTLRDVETAELVVFAAALVLTGVIGTGFVRLSLRPLRRVAAAATRVTELPLASGEVALADRVPGADPRTEVGQVGAAFNRMLGHVEAALARRAASEARLRRFAADASHELRTPLAAIRGYAELARRHPGPVPPDVAHALSRVEAESARMGVLVDELLLLAQLDAGRPLASAPVDLARLAIDAASDARAAAPGHRWRLDLPGEPVLVRGDEHRLHQVMVNLLGNVAKHTPPGTTVTVSVGPPGPAVTLSVTDDGPGIPAGLLPNLFERFVRGGTARTHAGGSTGTGLGLAIVSAVTAAHGGSVTVDSHPGHTRFTITLPGIGRSPGQAPRAGDAWPP